MLRGTKKILIACTIEANIGKDADEDNDSHHAGSRSRREKSSKDSSKRPSAKKRTSIHSDSSSRKHRPAVIEDPAFSDYGDEDASTCSGPRETILLSDNSENVMPVPVVARPPDGSKRAACYNELLKIREQMEQKRSSPYFVSKLVMQEIAKHCPTDIDELRQIRGLDANKIATYSETILDITKRFKL